MMTDSTFSLINYFHQQTSISGYTLDPIQENAIKQLESLAKTLCSSKKKNANHNFYLWGPVGRGKSWLLNTLYEGIPIAQKKRFHFHSFFRQLHQKIFTYTGHHDSLESSLEDLLADCKLLCFDEFHIHDIGDAMLILRLFKALFKRNIALVTTSNYSPNELLPNPLYHERFLPAIKLIEKNMIIIEIAGQTDYRTLPQVIKQGFTAGWYIAPTTLEQRQQLKLPMYTTQTLDIKVANRILNPTHYDENSITFNFEDLCEQTTAVMDYLILAEQFDIWIIDNIPLLNKATIAAQQRFINLIDILYDQNKCLYLLAKYPLEETLANTSIGDMARTRSRLNQLQKC